MVLRPGGVIEEPGPYLPVFTDGCTNAWWSERLGERLARKQAAWMNDRGVE